MSCQQTDERTNSGKQSSIQFELNPQKVSFHFSPTSNVMNISAKKAHFMLMKWLPGITLCPRILPESTQGNHFWTKSSIARETYSYFQDFRKTANLVQKPNHPNKLFLNLSRAVGGGLFLQLKAYEMFRHLRQVTMAITLVQKFSATRIV